MPCNHPSQKVPAEAARECISVLNARQNNLKNLSLEIPLRTFTVVTGVSGSGKSSLAFDTIYAEGQRRYIETFSSYARQFLERMDKPAVDAVTGIPPAIAVQQTGAVRTSRSTVGTMTEINDRLKLLWAKSAALYCPDCGRRVESASPDSVAAAAVDPSGPFAGGRVDVCFTVPPREGFPAEEVKSLLERQGFRHSEITDGGGVEVIVDRIAATPEKRVRIAEAAETAMRHGEGVATLRGRDGATRRSFARGLHCPDCGREFHQCDPDLFSFNSAAGACPHCHGFGRVIGVSRALVVPDGSLSLEQGCIKPWETASHRFMRRYMVKLAKKRGVPVDVPWRELTDAQRDWVWNGEWNGDEEDWSEDVWPGVRGFFKWLESRIYKVHVRVLLSRYREYTPCPECGGARLRPEALFWKLDFRDGAAPLTLPEFAALPVETGLEKARALSRSGALDEAGRAALDEVLPRLDYLVTVGLGYLSLDRQSRTLSGGETQRIELTTALGSALVNTLFVLDEPSVGLHPRDVGRLNDVLRKLRDAGNTLLVVEHDPDLIRAADRVLELGPGPGERGGRILFHGDIADLPATDTPTSRALFRTAPPPPLAPSAPPEHFIDLRGVTEHNLRDVDVSFPLERLVAVTGVSGSGKSTLVTDVLAPAVLRALGKPTEYCGAFRELRGVDSLDGAVLVDQAPVNKSMRSNPASYIGAFDAIRKFYARLPLAHELGYEAGDFSFNAGRGRCPDCEGTGWETVEMQFLSDVRLRCERCGGRRYHGEILSITHDSGGAKYSIADALELTVDAAIRVFADDPKITEPLTTLSECGLGYVTLGQPLSTLSGGETQRLKIADALRRDAADAKRGKILYLFDEPTTGLHTDDVRALLRVLRRLVAAGHSVVAIEHNLDFIAACDHVIDLGPEGGSGGGLVVAEGAPRAVARSGTHTGEALARYFDDGVTARLAAETAPRAALPAPAPAEIDVLGARENNLKNIDVGLPIGKFNVITGVSGSGKSTLAFDILFAEGRNRYLECLNAYARMFIQPPARPDVKSVLHLPPTVAIEQRISRGGRRSTVATTAELAGDLRLLLLSLGELKCPDCGEKVPGWSPLRGGGTTELSCPCCGREFGRPDPRMLSFNSHLGWCSKCQGYGVTGLKRTKAVTIAERDKGRRFSQGFADMVKEASEDGRRLRECPLCHGTRLNAVALGVTFRGFNFADFAGWSVSDALAWFSKLKLKPREAEVARDVVADLRSRLGFLESSGLGYLSLDRAAPTLSGGESQRIRLAAQLGSNLRGVCYILDEPTIGLHVRDNTRLLDTLCGLRDAGNTVVVVEHDEETIMRADHVIDVGPAAGTGGGRIVAEGTPAQILAKPESATGRALAAPMVHPVRGKSRPLPKAGDSAAWLKVGCATLHNLKNLDVALPLGRLVAVSGVSGSGKSTLVREVIAGSLINSTRGLRVKPNGCETLTGAETLRRMLEVDQSPIGRTPRSCPATYVGIWSDIRDLFAATPEARLRGWGAARFSFNVEGGRCPVCEGQGVVRTEMAFLPEVQSRCERCGGARFTPETLSVRLNGRSIADVLQMRVDEAYEFFAEHPAIKHALGLLCDVGLGYLALGQQSSTLSGGEAQRIKLVTELARCTPRPGRKVPATLYVLDEPTVGLHALDVRKLIDVLHRLVDAGHTVLVVEHNPDILAEADYLLDLGPDGGEGGGRIVAKGAPCALVKRPPAHSATVAALVPRMRKD